MVLLTLLLVVLLFVSLFLFIRWKRTFNALTKYGIKGPPPTLFYGNTKQIVEKKYLKFIEENIKEYGNVFSYFIGLKPCIIVRDLDMLRQILVKQFDNFTDRSDFASLVGVKVFKGVGIFAGKGDQWRSRRKILSKSFSAVKLNQMSTIIERSCDSLVIKVKENAVSGKSFDIWKLYGLYTLEVILAGGFGHSVDVLNGEIDELAESTAALFAQSRRGRQIYNVTLLSNFPFLSVFYKMIIPHLKVGKNLYCIHERTQQLLQNRLQDDTGNHRDLLQLLIEAKADSDDEGDDEGTEPRYKKLSVDDILMNSFTFLLAGYETTSNTLAYTSYLLAIHPEEQQKIFDEMDEYFQANPDASLLEASHSLKYVDMVIQESLRMYPPAPVVDRKVLKDTEVNGQVFPKDSTVVVPILDIHYSPDLWTEPTVFKPERFTREEKEKRHPMAHMPFGYGPRSCIGMRLALMEAKMALITIMKEYKFMETPDTEKPLKTEYWFTMAPANGIYIKVEKR